MADEAEGVESIMHACSCAQTGAAFLALVGRNSLVLFKITGKLNLILIELILIFRINI